MNSSIGFQPKLSISGKAEVVKLLPVIIHAALFVVSASGLSLLNYSIPIQSNNSENMVP